jgi:aquaporin Z
MSEESQYEAVPAEQEITAVTSTDDSEKEGESESRLTRMLLGTVSELVGSFLIFVTIYLTSALMNTLYGTNLVASGLIAGLVYALMIVVFGKFSGGQFNPATTLAAMITGKTDIWSGIAYIVAQVLGSIAAGGVSLLALPVSSLIPARIWLAKEVNGFGINSASNAVLANTELSFGPLLVAVVEVLASVIITAAALNSIDDNGESTKIAPILMGAAYALGTIITTPVTGGCLNPARATGIAIFAHTAGLPTDPLSQLAYFWICPIFAATIVSAFPMLTQFIHEVQTDKQETKELTSEGEPFEDAGHLQTTPDEYVAVNGAMDGQPITATHDPVEAIDTTDEKASLEDTPYNGNNNG